MPHVVGGVIWSIFLAIHSHLPPSNCELPDVSRSASQDWTSCMLASRLITCRGSLLGQPLLVLLWEASPADASEGCLQHGPICTCCAPVLLGSSLAHVSESAYSAVQT